MSYRFGSVVLVPFPFTDQSASKQRPAVVVSSAAYQQARPDVIIMAITSQLRPTTFDAELVDWRAAGLLKPSAVKPVITTVAQNLVRKSLGTLTSSDQQRLKEMLGKIVG
jgi:mRNA interferase MazF